MHVWRSASSDFDALLEAIDERNERLGGPDLGMLPAGQLDHRPWRESLTRRLQCPSHAWCPPYNARETRSSWPYQTVISMIERWGLPVKANRKVRSRVWDDEYPRYGSSTERWGLRVVSQPPGKADKRILWTPPMPGRRLGSRVRVGQMRFIRVVLPVGGNTTSGCSPASGRPSPSLSAAAL